MVTHFQAPARYCIRVVFVGPSIANVERTYTTCLIGECSVTFLVTFVHEHQERNESSFNPIAPNNWNSVHLTTIEQELANQTDVNIRPVTSSVELDKVVESLEDLLEVVLEHMTAVPGEPGDIPEVP